MTEKEYRELPSHEYYSQSLLVSFNREGPSALVNKDTDLDYKKQIRFGKICHHLALLPETFHDKYKVSSFFPTESYLKVADLIKDLYNRGLFTVEDILECKKEYSKPVSESILASDNWNNITKEGTILERICDSQFSSYVVESIRAEEKGKYLITSQEYLEAKEISDHLRKDKILQEFFVNEDVKKKQILFEIPVLFKIDKHNFKSILDNIYIIHSKKKIGFTDLKVTETPYTMFESMFIKMRRDIQSFVYTKALEEFMEKEGLTDYTIENPIYIYAQRGNPKMAMPFVVSKTIVDRAYHGFTWGAYNYKGVRELSETIKWHFDNKEFTYPKEYVENGRMYFENLTQNISSGIYGGSSSDSLYRFYGRYRPEFEEEGNLVVDMDSAQRATINRLSDEMNTDHGSPFT